MDIKVKLEQPDGINGSVHAPAATKPMHIKTEELDNVAIKSEARSDEIDGQSASVGVRSRKPKLVKRKSSKRTAVGLDNSPLPPKKKLRRVTELQQERRSRSKTPAHPLQKILAAGSELEPETELEETGRILHQSSQASTRENLRIKDKALLQRALDQFKNTVEDNGRFKIRECVTPLTIWQFVSAYQMIRRERVRKAPFGGALSSEMGVRLYLQMLRKAHMMPKTNWSQARKDIDYVGGHRIFQQRLQVEETEEHARVGAKRQHCQELDEGSKRQM